MENRKEEILEDCDYKYSYDEGMKVVTELAAKMAMDEWARERSIAFGKWLKKEGYWTIDSLDGWHKGAEKISGIRPTYSTEKLYDLFTNSINK